jgi:hypothetical protein
MNILLDDLTLVPVSASRGFGLLDTKLIDAKEPVQVQSHVSLSDFDMVVCIELFKEESRTQNHHKQLLSADMVKRNSRVGNWAARLTLVERVKIRRVLVRHSVIVH